MLVVVGERGEASAADSGWPGPCSALSISKMSRPALISEFVLQVMMMYELVEQMRVSAVRKVFGSSAGGASF